MNFGILYSLMCLFLVLTYIVYDLFVKYLSKLTSFYVCIMTFFNLQISYEYRFFYSIQYFNAIEVWFNFMCKDLSWDDICVVKCYMLKGLVYRIGIQQAASLIQVEKIICI